MKPHSATGMEVILKLLLALQSGSLFTRILKYLKPLTQILRLKCPCSRSHSLSPNFNTCFFPHKWSLTLLNKCINPIYVGFRRRYVIQVTHKHIYVCRRPSRRDKDTFQLALSHKVTMTTATEQDIYDSFATMVTELQETA